MTRKQKKINSVIQPDNGTAISEIFVYILIR